MTTVLDGATLGQEAERRIMRLANRLATATGGGTPYGLSALVAAGNTYREALTCVLGEQVGQHVARIALETLVDERERQDPKFWASPLGRACAWWIGGLGFSVPRSLAAAALGCSRQNIHERLAAGALVMAPGEGVTAESLRAEMRRRYPHSTGGGQP